MKSAVLNNKICTFSDRDRASFLEKKFKAQRHIQNDSILRSGFLRSDDGPAFWIFLGFKYDAMLRSGFLRSDDGPAISHNL